MSYSTLVFLTSFLSLSIDWLENKGGEVWEGMSQVTGMQGSDAELSLLQIITHPTYYYQEICVADTLPGSD